MEKWNQRTWRLRELLLVRYCSQSLYITLNIFCMEMHGKNFTLITRQVKHSNVLLYEKWSNQWRFYLKMLTVLNIVLGKSMHLGFGNWGLISHSASYLCDPGKLFSQNLFCQLSREHYNPSPPGLSQGLHKMMQLKRLMCDWHPTGMQ